MYHAEISMSSVSQCIHSKANDSFTPTADKSCILRRAFSLDTLSFSNLLKHISHNAMALRAFLVFLRLVSFCLRLLLACLLLSDRLCRAEWIGCPGFQERAHFPWLQRHPPPELSTRLPVQQCVVDFSSTVRVYHHREQKLQRVPLPFDIVETAKDCPCHS